MGSASVSLSCLRLQAGERRQADAGMGSYLCAKAERERERESGSGRTVRVHLVVGGLALAAVHDAELVVERSLLLLELEDLALQLGRRHFARTCLQAADVQVSARQQMVCACVRVQPRDNKRVGHWPPSRPLLELDEISTTSSTRLFFFLCENSRTRCHK